MSLCRRKRFCTAMSAIIIKSLLNHRVACWNIHEVLSSQLCLRMFVHNAKYLLYWQAECSNPDRIRKCATLKADADNVRLESSRGAALTWSSALYLAAHHPWLKAVALLSRRPRVIFKLAVAMCSWPLRESLSVLTDFTVFDVAESSFAQLEKSIGHDVFCAIHSVALFSPSFQNDLIL